MDKIFFCFFAFMMGASIKIWHFLAWQHPFFLWAALWLLCSCCVLPVKQPEQETRPAGHFRVRHDSRLDRFQLIIYRPVENKKRCVCTSRPSFRRTIVLPSSMLRWSHTCASVVHNCQWHLTCCLIDRSPCPSLVELEDIRETRLNNTSGPALCCLTNVKC